MWTRLPQFWPNRGTSLTVTIHVSNINHFCKPPGTASTAVNLFKSTNIRHGAPGIHSRRTLRSRRHPGLCVSAHAVQLFDDADDCRRTRSVPSIVAGVTIGAIYGYAGLLLKDNKDWGVETALAASVLLGGSSIPRALRTRESTYALTIDNNDQQQLCCGCFGRV